VSTQNGSDLDARGGSQGESAQPRPTDHQHGGLHRAGAEPVQRLLAGLRGGQAARNYVFSVPAARLPRMKGPAATKLGNRRRRPASGKVMPTTGRSEEEASALALRLVVGASA
jgi:hypothetical protein